MFSIVTVYQSHTFLDQKAENFMKLARSVDVIIWWRQSDRPYPISWRSDIVRSTIVATATDLLQNARRLVFAARSDLKSSSARLESAPPSLMLSLVDLPPSPLPPWSSPSSTVLSPSSSYIRDLSAGFCGELGKTLISLGWNGDTMCTSDSHTRLLRSCRGTIVQSWLQQAIIRPSVPLLWRAKSLQENFVREVIIPYN